MSSNYIKTRWEIYLNCFKFFSLPNQPPPPTKMTTLTLDIQIIVLHFIQTGKITTYKNYQMSSLPHKKNHLPPKKFQITNCFQFNKNRENQLTTISNKTKPFPPKNQPLIA